MKTKMISTFFLLMNIAVLYADERTYDVVQIHRDGSIQNIENNKIVCDSKNRISAAENIKKAAGFSNEGNSFFNFKTKNVDMGFYTKTKKYQNKIITKGLVTCSAQSIQTRTKTGTIQNYLAHTWAGAQNPFKSLEKMTAQAKKQNEEFQNIFLLISKTDLDYYGSYHESLETRSMNNAMICLAISSLPQEKVIIIESWKSPDEFDNLVVQRNEDGTTRYIVTRFKSYTDNKGLMRVLSKEFKFVMSFSEKNGFTF